MNEIGPITRLRFKQIRVFSKILEGLSYTRHSHSTLRALGKSPWIAYALVGFRRTFASFATAERCIRRYKVPSHEHPANLTQHLFSFGKDARISDYPVLFHMQRLLGEVQTVLDVGGSGGNLFYCYSHYLAFPKNLRWTVFDLPRNIETGRQIAQERGEQRLKFVDDLAQCADAEVVIISGSLHYFEALPPELFRFLDHQPRHVFINRTPVVNGPSAITIQDAHSYYGMSAARILSRATLLESMTAANYELIDEWAVPDLKLRIPLDPGSSATAYSGFYFRARNS